MHIYMYVMCMYIYLDIYIYTCVCRIYMYVYIYYGNTICRSNGHDGKQQENLYKWAPECKHQGTSLTHL